MNFKTALFFSFIVLLFACSEKPITEKVEQLPYHLKKSFTLALEGVPTNTWMVDFKTIDETDYLFYGDIKSKDKILVYNLDKKHWVDTLNFQKEGPEGIGTINGFFIQSWDSIYLVNSFGWKIHHMQGEKKNP
tara:strand:- start:1429 stop:1827 length:399 start_codon:yes stop_codon:yes gene_type:complete